MKQIEAKIEALQKEVQKMKPTNAKQLLLQNISAMKYVLNMASPKPRPMNPDHVFIKGQNFKPHAKEGDKILDTHLGSGSIAIACHNLGFDLTACELDKEYYNNAMKRIKQHTDQQRLF